ncbi:pentapeptide repeat-containing protein [Methylocystis sp. WRRC1]|uniref:pentapeptide repeat-containing protein n=1 Tax=Methylocystis sp. WRRC1 TaxID=1732014 RepID=UPI001D15DB8C|nr:pentapeptide repeat-containing protein [Methylocystis sp. WRRC1]MCC3244301.1 pentapeptide repeat-containing protein [Methylocystis sp. WRRC1]
MTDDAKPNLTPANENPWYLLATLYGEQEEVRDSKWLLLVPIGEANRKAWNRWMATAFQSEELETLLPLAHIKGDLKPFTSEETDEFRAAFAKRAGRQDIEPPNPSKEFMDFSRCQFDRPVFFRGFIFPRLAHFIESKFSGPVYFDTALFFSYVRFDMVHFGDFVSFHMTDFRSGASFEKAHFARVAFFENSKFDAAAFFEGAQFCGNASFVKTTFLQKTSFDHAEFLKSAQFTEAIFSTDTVFENTSFGSDADFQSAGFLSATYFGDSIFAGRAKFNGTDFKLYMSFIRSKFQKSVPDFRDAKLPEATELHGAKWPSPPKNHEDAQQQIYAYERLKAEMERLKKHEDEQFFFARELRARRALLWLRIGDKKRRFGERVNDGVAWFMNSAYDSLGSYGLSVVRPIFWLVSLFSVGFVILASTNSLDDGPMEPSDAAALSVTNLISLLPYKPDKLITDHLTPAAKIIGNIQSVLGLILLFLLGLALRNRFRMK